MRAFFFRENLFHALRECAKCVMIWKTQREGYVMDMANRIKELREQTGMTRKEFSEYTHIPVRTLEDWEAGRRTPPEYIPRLLGYQLKFDEMMNNK